jgi:glucose dehydrogenase
MANYDFDVVIVGAGISGAILASKLASSTCRVLLIEAGEPLQNRQNWLNQYYAGNWPYPTAKDAPQQGDPGPDWRNPQTNYWQQLGPLAFDSNYERRTGGTTLHWLGTSMRFVPYDFKLSSHYKVPGAMDWPVTYDDLEPWYVAAEKEIGVAGDSSGSNPIDGKRSANYPMPMVPQSYLDQQISPKVNGQSVNGVPLLVSATPQGRNTIGYDNRPPCMGNTSCVPICPIQAKYDASVTLKKALAAGATLWTQTVVTRVTIDTQNGNKISGVAFKRWDGSTGTVTGRRYVLAAHAIETAKILLMSQWYSKPDGTQVTAANNSDQVGRNLMDHVCQLSWGLTPSPVYPFRGPLSTSGIESFRDGTPRQTRAAYRIEVGNDGWSWPLGSPQSDVVNAVKKGQFGKALRASVQDLGTRQIRMAFEMESIGLAGSRVQLSKLVDPLGIPRPMISYQLSDYTMKGYAESRSVALQIFKLIGIQDLTQIDKTAPGYFQYQGQDYQYRGAGHVIGTYRMGDNKGNSVVDKFQRSWDHGNLFLVGSGVFPTTGTANPTLTIAALTLWAAQTIRQDLAS